jgi:hypothetical protein
LATVAVALRRRIGANTRLVPVLPATALVECRILIAQQPDGCVVQLAGCLKAAQVHELRRVCDGFSGRLRIDLSDLLSADAVGIDALRRLRRDGAEFMGVAQYLNRWLA